MIDMTGLSVRENDGGVVFTAKIVPGSSGLTRICGLLDGMLKVKVSAPPEKGKANQGLLKCLAKALGVKKNALSILSGTTSPVKQVQVLGISVGTLMKKLNLTEYDVRK
ncbi:MAG: DUF167 domain-containing protein [Sedimentisphaerales bacterium]|jgi:uncharacterized protein (TIGR00251 family)